jgi:tyrosine-protein phosphatase YwqE
MEDIPNTTASLRDRFEELKSRYRGNIELHLSAENMLDNLFMERLENNDVLPLGEKSNHLLVETTCYTPPIGLCDIMRRIKSKGYYPVLAHPERYVYMDKSDYQQLKDLGVKFQLNLLSLVGAYGKFIQKRAEYLLKGSMYDIAGSDLHKLAQCHILFESRVLSRDVVKALHLLFTQTDNSNQNIEKRTRVRKKLYAPS